MVFVDKMSQPAQSGQVLQPLLDLSGVERPQVSLLPQPQAEAQEGHSSVQVDFTQPFSSVYLEKNPLEANRRHFKSNANLYVILNVLKNKI